MQLITAADWALLTQVVDTNSAKIGDGREVSNKAFPSCHGLLYSHSLSRFSSTLICGDNVLDHGGTPILKIEGPGHCRKFGLKGVYFSRVGSD